MWDSDGSRNTAEHKAWRLEVLNRDGWTCTVQHQGCEGKANEAHHLIRPAARPDLEHDPANGVAACTSCHKVETQKQATEGKRAFHARARRQPERHPGIVPPPVDRG